MVSTLQRYCIIFSNLNLILHVILIATTTCYAWIRWTGGTTGCFFQSKANLLKVPFLLSGRGFTMSLMLMCRNQHYKNTFICENVGISWHSPSPPRFDTLFMVPWSQPISIILSPICWSQFTTKTCSSETASCPRWLFNPWNLIVTLYGF